MHQPGSKAGTGRRRLLAAWFISMVGMVSATLALSGAALAETITWEGTITVSDTYEHTYGDDLYCSGISEVSLSTTYSLSSQPGTTVGDIPTLAAVFAPSGETGSAIGSAICSMYPNGGCGLSTKTESVTDGPVVISSPSSPLRGSLIYFPAEQKLAFVPIDGSRELTLPPNSYQTTSTQPADFCNGSRTRPGLTFRSIGGPRLTNTPQGDFRLPVEVNGLTLRVQGTYEFFATGGAAGGGSNLLPIGNYSNFDALYESGANTNVSNREVITVDLRASLGVELTVATEGTGEGAVTSSPPGIDCGIVCRADYAVGTDVTLTPAPAQGSRFVRWDGACTGSLGCVVTMDQNKSVIAVFEETPAPQPGTIQGFKVNDLNDNNLADTGEPLLPGWTIRIYRDSNGNDQLDPDEITTVQESVTNQDGDYQSSLPAGDYLVCEARQAAGLSWAAAGRAPSMRPNMVRAPRAAAPRRASRRVTGIGLSFIEYTA